MARVARLLVALTLCADVCAAQTANEAAARPDEVMAFPAAYFDEFRPNTALDMINRLPGFAYSRGNGDVRGLAGAGGNVLIDGQRPVSKSLSLDDVIRRIPLEAIERIDLIRGGASNIDMQGQPVVANIVRKPGGYTAVVGEFMTKFYADRAPARNPRVEVSRSQGDWTMSGALGWRDEREQANTGTGTIVRRNVLTGSSRSDPFEADWDRTDLNGNGGLEYNSGAHLVRLNVSGRREADDRREWMDAFDPSRREATRTGTIKNQGEISLDYENALSARLIGRAMLLRRAERNRKQARSTIGIEEQQADDDALTREAIARLSATYTPEPALTLEASAEGSINTLGANSLLVRNGVPVALPSANINVEERRGNVATAARWQASARTSVELGLGYEASTIRQSGDVAQEKGLEFWKPRLALTIDPAASAQVRLRAERLVGQLNFNDFAANVSTEPGEANAGNPDLVPETSWLAEVTIERRFWGRGAVTLTASHADISDVVDLIPIDNRFDAPGNIGSGWRQEMRLALTLPTERLAIAGGQIRINGTVRRSRVIDPVTGEARRISRERPLSGELLVSKDLPGLRSVIGTDLYMGFEETAYRLTEVRVERASNVPLTRLYWDWTPTGRTSVRFQVENFTFRSRGRTRIQYQGARADGVVAQVEDRSVTLDPFIMIRLRQRL